MTDDGAKREWDWYMHSPEGVEAAKVFYRNAPMEIVLAVEREKTFFERLRMLCDRTTPEELASFAKDMPDKMRNAVIDVFEFFITAKENES